MCFYNGMTESAKAGLQYVYPTYLILIIILIIVLSQHSRLMQRVLSDLSGIHVLVSMFYISFLKIFRTVIDTVTFVDVESEDHAESFIGWFYDGNQRIEDPLPIFLVVLASVTFLIGIVPYVIFFTFINLIQRWITSTRVNAYVDASLAPYKHNYRFWFGARLILITIIYSIIANRGISNPTLTLTLELSLLVGFALVQAYIQPFKSQIVSLIDLSILINLIVLTLGTSYTIQNENRINDQRNLVNVSISVVLITNIGIILGHILIILRKNENIKETVDPLIERVNMAFMAVFKHRDRKMVVEIMTGKGKEDKGEGGERDSNPRLTGSNVSKHQLGLPKSREGPPSTTVSLQDLANADDKQDSYQHLSNSQFREPVLEFMDNDFRHTA